MGRFVHPHFQGGLQPRIDSYDDAAEKYATAGEQSRAAVQAAIDKHGAKRTGI